MKFGLIPLVGFAAFHSPNAFRDTSRLLKEVVDQFIGQSSLINQATTQIEDGV
ncbi:MAG: hypothetical protein WBC55_06800 [Dehalococcoidia bacterium]